MGYDERSSMFSNDCGFFGLNLSKITMVSMEPGLENSVLVHFDMSGIPCFRLKHRTPQLMEMTFENLNALINKKPAKIVNINEYKFRRNK